MKKWEELDMEKWRRKEFKKAIENVERKKKMVYGPIKEY